MIASLRPTRNSADAQTWITTAKVVLDAVLAGVEVEGHLLTVAQDLATSLESSRAADRSAA